MDHEMILVTLDDVFLCRELSSGNSINMFVRSKDTAQYPLSIVIRKTTISSCLLMNMVSKKQWAEFGVEEKEGSSDPPISLSGLSVWRLSQALCQLMSGHRSHSRSSQGWATDHPTSLHSYVPIVALLTTGVHHHYQMKVFSIALFPHCGN